MADSRFFIASRRYVVVVVLVDGNRPFLQYSREFTSRPNSAAPAASEEGDPCRRKSGRQTRNNKARE